MASVAYDGRSAPGDALLADMFIERKRVFIDLLGWELSALEGRYELDQFDTPATRYIICTADDAEHMGSLRLIPCNRPYLLASIFPSLCAMPLPGTASTWEISRLCLSRRIGAANRLRARNALATALVRFALENGISNYCCVADKPWFDQVRTFGWQCEMMGPIQDLPVGKLAALSIAVDGSTPGLLQATGVWCEGQLAITTTKTL